MKILYGNMPAENLGSYFDTLINKTFKILPMKEEGSDTLKSYLNSLLRELIGNSDLIVALKDEPRFITVISTMAYLAKENYDNAICKKEVFKCIHLLKDIRERWFGGEMDGEI